MNRHIYKTDTRTLLVNLFTHEHDKYSKSWYVVQFRRNEDVTCEFSQYDFDHLSCEKKCIQISLLQNIYKNTT